MTPKLKPIQTIDPINHPAHYAGIAAKVECIDVARHLPYALGCAVKYLWRAGKKDPTKKLEDLEKALWYLQDYGIWVGDGEINDIAWAVWCTCGDDVMCEKDTITGIILGDIRSVIAEIEQMIKEEKKKEKLPTHQSEKED